MVTAQVEPTGHYPINNRNRCIQEAFMRQILFLGTALALAALQTASAAQAREYPWCARYSWSTYNCGFNTYGQCLATISGVGGYCERNPRALFGQPRARRYRH
jgi:hypothetical protein